MTKRNKKKAKGRSSGSTKRNVPRPKVHFVFRAPEANSVYLAGEFNGWQSQALPMTKRENGVWDADMELGAGRYEYKLFVDGSWMEDRSCEVVFERGAVKTILESEPVVNSFGTANYAFHFQPGRPER